MTKENLLRCLKTHLSSKGQTSGSIQSYTASVFMYLNWLSRQALNPIETNYSDLLSYIDHSRSRGNSPGTLQWKLQSIKHFYKALQTQKIVTENPTEDLQIRGRIKRLPQDLLEYEYLEELYQNHPSGSLTKKRNKNILGMFIYQGLNSGEVAKLEIKDLKLKAGKVQIPGTSKSNPRILKLAPEQILELQEYIMQVREKICLATNKKSDKLFVSHGESLSLKNSLAKLMRSLKKRDPKIKNVHQIRASVITHWLSKYHLRQVQYMAGHRYVSSTERYQTDHLETLQKQIDELHPLAQNKKKNSSKNPQKTNRFLH
jgi:integrase/recombinase XerD